jgi:hypothetical protein
LRPVFGIASIQPSEWRRSKHGYKAPISRGTREAQKIFRDGRIEDNNRRIFDTRHNHNFATGKRKRSGIYATGRGL